MSSISFRRLNSLILLGLFSAGCARGPSRVAAPDWDPPGFADAILEELDKNSDGAVDKEEVATAPGLAFGFRFIDTNGDSKLSRDELVARFTLYRDMRIGMTPKTFQITHNGRPLSAAQIKFVPEFFLTDLLEPASGDTDNTGIVQPGIEGEPMAVMRVGYYRVEVRSPRGELPAKFNTETTLGVEVSPVSDDPTTYGTIQIQLRDKKKKGR